MNLINSAPAAFPLATVGAGVGGAAIVTFTLPAGVSVAGAWQVSGVNGANSGFYTLSLAIGTAAPFTLGTHGSGAFSTPLIAITPAQLDAINAAAGTGISVTITSTPASPLPAYNEAITVFTLTLLSTSVGIAGTFGLMVSLTDAGEQRLLINLLDANGDLAAAPTGGQSFTLTDSYQAGVFLTPSPVVIAALQSQSLVNYTNPNNGRFPITVTPGAGPLLGGDAQHIELLVEHSSPPIPGGGIGESSPSACVCALYRSHIRDAVRRRLGSSVPADQGYGMPGDEPAGQEYPGNAVLNQCIADAIRDINQRCRLHEAILQTPVAAVSATQVGPAYITLTGLAGCSQELGVNSVIRALWVPSGGPPALLESISIYEQDRFRPTFDLLTPSVPNRFFVFGYQVALVPAPILAGTLQLFVGSAITQFCDDTTPIDQVPNDYVKVIEDGAAMYACLYKPDKYAKQLPEWKGLFAEGIGQINRFVNGVNESFQPSIGFASYRFVPGRGGVTFNRRRT